MTAAWHDLHCEQGATFSRTIRYEEEAGQAIDLTGWTARMQVRRNRGFAGSELLATFDSVGGGITAPDETGRFVITIAASETGALPLDPLAQGDPPLTRLVYDLEIEAPDGTVERLLEGAFIVHPEVTQ